MYVSISKFSAPCLRLQTRAHSRGDVSFSGDFPTRSRCEGEREERGERERGETKEVRGTAAEQTLHPQTTQDRETTTPSKHPTKMCAVRTTLTHPGRHAAKFVTGYLRCSPRPWVVPASLMCQVMSTLLQWCSHTPR